MEPNERHLDTLKLPRAGDGRRGKPPSGSVALLFGGGKFSKYAPTKLLNLAFEVHCSIDSCLWIACLQNLKTYWLVQNQLAIK